MDSILVNHYQSQYGITVGDFLAGLVVRFYTMGGISLKAEIL